MKVVIDERAERQLSNIRRETPFKEAVSLHVENKFEGTPIGEFCLRDFVLMLLGEYEVMSKEKEFKRFYLKLNSYERSLIAKSFKILNIENVYANPKLEVIE